ncbi:MAG: hypothetical protein WAW96_12070 [Alphaproteobacteria bacterium]
MMESDVANQIVQMMSLTLQGMGVVFSIVSAYVVALYYFLYRAPLILKLGSFLFFTLIVALLVFFTLGAFDHGAAITRTLADMAQKAPLTPIGQAALARGSLGTTSIDQELRLSIEAAFALVYLSLFYLTFFHRWTHADYTERD